MRPEGQQAPRFLVADDEPDLLRICSEVLASNLQANGDRPRVRTASNGSEAREALTRETFDLILLDVKMPGVRGLELMHFALEHGRGAPVVLLTAYPNYEDAVTAIKEGAFHYVVKPFTAAQLLEVAARALARGSDPLAERPLAGPTGVANPLDAFLGQGRRVRHVRDLVRQVAPLSESVVLHGETGTGKGLIARILHATGPRADCPMVTFDCGAIPRELMESELFGHEKGAFTGAAAGRKGLLELADGGTLFLDEVAEIPLELQTRLLRALQEREFRRVGGARVLQFTGRVISATNRDLEAEVEQGRFRSDLYYRLHVIPIRLPALREHPEDIPILAQACIDRFADNNSARSVHEVSQEALSILRGYRWPGNVRELENVIRRAAAFARDGVIRAADLPTEIRDQPTNGMAENGFSQAREQWLSSFEEQYFRDLLTQTSGNVVEAAQASGVPRATLYRYLRKHDLNPADFRVSGVRSRLTDETDL